MLSNYIKLNIVKTKELTLLNNLAGNVGLMAIDVGARGSVKKDLEYLKSSIDWLCLEPDKDAPLNTKGTEWKSVDHIPFAAAMKEEIFKLNLNRQRGCSSKYEADLNIAARYSREEYYHLDKHVYVKARPLDRIVKENTKQKPAFLKIDVQGMELECFQGSKNLLENMLVGIRTEVSFFKVYKGQPLLSEIEQYLRPFGFQPMQWIEFHEWRRSTRDKLPNLGPYPMPYSKGQMAHGDLLYLLQPEELPSNTEDQIKRLIRLGLVAVCYDLLDHAQVAFSRPVVRDYCRDVIQRDPVDIINKISQKMAFRYKGLFKIFYKISAWLKQ